MAWAFDSVVDSGRDRDQASGRKVFYARALLTQGNESQCVTTYWYDNAPTTPQRTARLNEILDRLNTPPVVDLWETIRDLVRDRVQQAQTAGKTQQQIITGITNALS